MYTPGNRLHLCTWAVFKPHTSHSIRRIYNGISNRACLQAGPGHAPYASRKPRRCARPTSVAAAPLACAGALAAIPPRKGPCSSPSRCREW